jgi:hypothetical protein
VNACTHVTWCLPPATPVPAGAEELPPPVGAPADWTHIRLEGPPCHCTSPLGAFSGPDELSQTRLHQLRSKGWTAAQLQGWSRAQHTFWETGESEDLTWLQQSAAALKGGGFILHRYIESPGAEAFQIQRQESVSTLDAQTVAQLAEDVLYLV